ncbi:luciferin 4-monooxygenase-like [Phlebotomus argentipes]|uniref:luciferin 4-monooxygenase-like n=1 Tax=Phlebotomus argentipes TaxID=94469 RepID=UPI0028937FA8|nr:luciferin 4-monooxygenase-like [Phlebotomus argentipes]
MDIRRFSTRRPKFGAGLRGQRSSARPCPPAAWDSSTSARIPTWCARSTAPPARRRPTARSTTRRSASPRACGSWAAARATSLASSRGTTTAWPRPCWPPSCWRRPSTPWIPRSPSVSRTPAKLRPKVTVFCFAEEIIHMFGITKPKFVFCESDKVPVLREALQVLKNDAKIIVFGDRLADSLHIEDFLADPGDLGAFSPPEVDDDTCAVIFCSSGTTGLPKGVCINHRNLNFIAAYGYTDDEVEKPYKILTFTSIYWVTAVLTLLVGLGRSTRLIVPESYSDDFFYKIIKKYRPEIIFTGPMYFEGLINHPSIQVSDLDSIKVYICGGSVVSQALWEKSKVFLRNGELRCAYGMSEISFISKAPPKASKRSEGYILSGQQVRILDEDGENLGVGEQGEICIKWQHMFRGYFDNPEATAKVLDADGWLHSGDIGFFDQDNQLHVMGRSKDLIEYNYFKITPGEIENVILSVPGVRQAVVVGVPDPKFVDLPAAVVIRKEGSSVTEQDIAAAIEARLSDHKRLRGGIYFVDSVPTTPSGKVKKQLVKENVVKLYREKQQGI